VRIVPRRVVLQVGRRGQVGAVFGRRRKVCRSTGAQCTSAGGAVAKATDRNRGKTDVSEANRTARLLPRHVPPGKVQVRETSKNMLIMDITITVTVIFVMYFFIYNVSYNIYSTPNAGYTLVYRDKKNGYKHLEHKKHENTLKCGLRVQIGLLSLT